MISFFAKHVTHHFLTIMPLDCHSMNDSVKSKQSCITQQLCLISFFLLSSFLQHDSPPPPHLDEVVGVLVVPGVADEHAHVVQHRGGLHEEAVVVVQRQRQLRAAVLAARAARLHPPQDLLHKQSGRFSPPVAVRACFSLLCSKSRTR
jgi:hypothetical protein